MSITAQFLADRFERTTVNANAIIDAERAAREAKTERLRKLRLATEQQAKEVRRPRAAAKPVSKARKPAPKAKRAKASK